MGYKIAGQDIFPIIKEHQLDVKYKLNAEDLQAIQDGKKDHDLMLKVLNLAAVEKKLFPPAVRDEIESKIERVLRYLKQIDQKMMKTVRDSNFLGDFLGIDSRIKEKMSFFKQSSSEMKAVRDALLHGNITVEDAALFAKEIAKNEHGINPDFERKLREIVEGGEKPNRGGRQRDS